MQVVVRAPGTSKSIEEAHVIITIHLTITLCHSVPRIPTWEFPPYLGIPTVEFHGEEFPPWNSTAR
jgi:hypothetical protein